MTQKRERIAAWAVQKAGEAERQETLRQVTARLKEGLHGGGDRLTLDKLKRAAAILDANQIRGLRAHMIIIDDIVDYKTASDDRDDRVDALKYAMGALWSMPVLKPEDIAKISTI